MRKVEILPGMLDCANYGISILICNDTSQSYSYLLLICDYKYKQVYITP